EPMPGFRPVYMANKHRLARGHDKMAKLGESPYRRKRRRIVMSCIRLAAPLLVALALASCPAIRRLVPFYHGLWPIDVYSPYKPGESRALVPFGLGFSQIQQAIFWPHSPTSLL
ncbi:MAG TPA: hypothetical protein VFC45_02110, partial [Pseudolabrys sp.]|nr:hypothetical protein [Pseudolabrys sp.]